jgi:hypothetical protein
MVWIGCCVADEGDREERERKTERQRAGQEDKEDVRKWDGMG